MRIFITGITGFLGMGLLRQIPPDWTVGGLSRDEHKISRLWETFPGVEMFLGDVTRSETLKSALETFNPDIVIHAAALKVIPVGEVFPEMFITTNLLGTLNLLKATQSPIVFVSSDKAVDPLNLYGVAKRAAEIAVMRRQGNTVVRFGNVFGSTGSVYRVWRRQMAGGHPITVTDLTMTRFFITRRQAVKFILDHLKPGLWIPILKSYSLGEFLAAFQEVHGKLEIQHIPVREGEKWHELLVSRNEMHQAFRQQDAILISPYVQGNLTAPFGSDSAERVNQKTLIEEMKRWNLSEQNTVI